MLAHRVANRCTNTDSLHSEAGSDSAVRAEDYQAGGPCQLHHASVSKISQLCSPQLACLSEEVNM